MKEMLILTEGKKNITSVKTEDSQHAPREKETLFEERKQIFLMVHTAELQV